MQVNIVHYTKHKQSNQNPTFPTDPRNASFLHPSPTQYFIISPLTSTPAVRCVEFWSVECGLECVMFGVWNMVYDVRCVVWGESYDRGAVPKVTQNGQFKKWQEKLNCPVWWENMFVWLNVWYQNIKHNIEIEPELLDLKYLSLEPWKYIQSQISHVVFFVAGAAFDQFDLFWPMGLNLTLYYVCLVWHLIQQKRGQRSPKGPLGPSTWARRSGVEHPKLLVLYISYINLSILPILGQNSVGKIN